MPAQDGRRRSSLGRRPTRHGGQRRLSMELPERLQYNENEEDEEEEETGKEGQAPAFMHQSIFGMIAATQSKMNFQSRFHEAISESEDEAGPSRPTKQPSKTSGGPSNTSGEAASSQPKSRHRLSERKLPRTSPAAKASPTQPPTTYNIPRHQLPSQPRGTLPSHEQQSSGADKAPYMSQMLQARAKADLESSEATLTRPKSGRESPTPSLTSRVALSDALKDIFQFEEAEEVIAEYPCWYLQSVLLEGYMYITQNHISFYAYLAKKGNATIKSGHLSKRGRHNPQYRRYWFVLKNDVFSYYLDASDLYFPRDTIDLRYAISAELLPEKDKSKDTAAFSITTNARIFYFRADSAQSAKEWVKQVQNIIFRSHNHGDSVKISIPIDNAIEIEENPLIDFADTIKIKVIDSDETYAVDEYLFSFFGCGKQVLQDLKDMTRHTSAKRALAGTDSEGRPSRAAVKAPPARLRENVHAVLSPAPASRLSSQGSSPSGEVDRSRSSGNGRLDKAYHNKFGRTSSAQRESGGPQSRSTVESLNTSSEHVNESDLDESMDDTDASGSHILSGSTMFHNPTIHKQQGTEGVEGKVTEPSRVRSRDQPSTKINPESTSPVGHEQLEGKASTTSDHPSQEGPKLRQAGSAGALGGLMRASAIPIQRATTYLKTGPGKTVTSLLGTSPMEYYSKVSGMIAGGQKHYADADGLSTDDHVRDPDDEMDILKAEHRFREHFALPDSERLVATYFAFLHRGLPLYGKIYVGTTRLCFRSLLVGTRTKLVVPFKDLLNVDKEKGFRLGYQGMVVVIRGREEIFFEFGKQAHRDDCTITILRALDPVTSPKESLILTEGQHKTADVAAAENLLLQVAREESHDEMDDNIPRNIYQSEPDLLFDDPASSMLDFKPPEPLRIVCLTIGSRGDVQPYIALCKALMAEGHRPKIASHAEFGPWVEQHGIEFAPVEGNPADLMRICVEYGMFTPKFLVKANWEFRGFVKTLLETAWEACKDADLLVESPSAMAGIHIAEALKIPYFRAFTMPWTRTRAYPHAFAVPNSKMGGAYNYMTYTLFDHMFWQSTAGMINHWRGKALRLKPISWDRLQQDKVPFLYNFSPSVVVPPLDFSEWIRVTGYWFLDEGLDYKPPSVLEKFISKARKDGQKLVYIGFGSVVVSNSKELTQSVVESVLKADVRCILAKGWSDRLDKGKPKKKGEIEVSLPPSIIQITDPVPHDWLFRQVDAVVHHGGAGTTGASLRAGVPTIIHPFFGDQYFFSNRVQDLGVGIEVRRITEMTLGRALWFACHDHRMREKAKELGKQIRSEDGVGNAIKAIYRDMEYAKTLVQKRESLAYKSSGDGSEDTDNDDDEEEDVEVEEWTLVDNDSDPEAANPKAMMQPEQARSSGGRRRASPDY